MKGLLSRVFVEQRGLVSAFCAWNKKPNSPDLSAATFATVNRERCAGYFDSTRGSIVMAGSFGLRSISRANSSVRISLRVCPSWPRSSRSAQILRISSSTRTPYIPLSRSEIVTQVRRAAFVGMGIFLLG